MSIRGYLDTVRNNSVFGWAAEVYERSGEYGLAVVEVVLERKVIARARADRFRADLKADGIGTGAHAFEIALPGIMRQGGPFVIEVRAVGTGPPVPIGRRVVVRGEASDAGFAKRLDPLPPPAEPSLDQMLEYVVSVSDAILLAQAEELRSELGNAALVAYLYGTLLQRMPEREAYDNYVMALNLRLFDTKAIWAEIVESEEYKSG